MHSTQVFWLNASKQVSGLLSSRRLTLAGLPKRLSQADEERGTCTAFAGRRLKRE